MIAKAQTGEIILLLAAPKPAHHWYLVCFGPRRHYRKDGTCKHTAMYLAAMRSDWYRRRTRVTPFGDRGAA